MPIQFFTDAERQRLDNFPLEIQYQDLATFFTLSETDKAQIPIYSTVIIVWASLYNYAPYVLWDSCLMTFKALHQL